MNDPHVVERSFKELNVSMCVHVVRISLVGFLMRLPIYKFNTKNLNTISLHVYSTKGSESSISLQKNNRERL